MEQASTARIRQAILKIQELNATPATKHIETIRAKMHGAKMENPDGIAGFVNNSL